MLKLPDNELYLLLQDTRLIHDLMINHGMTFSVVPVLDEHGVETDARALQAEGEERGLARLDSTLAKRVAVSYTVHKILGRKGTDCAAHDASRGI